MVLTSESVEVTVVFRLLGESLLINDSNDGVVLDTLAAVEVLGCFGCFKPAFDCILSII